MLGYNRRAPGSVNPGLRVLPIAKFIGGILKGIWRIFTPIQETIERLVYSLSSRKLRKDKFFMNLEYKNYTKQNVNKFFTERVPRYSDEIDQCLTTAAWKV